MPNLGLSVGQGIAVWKKAGLSKAEAGKTKNFLDRITENFEIKTEDDINKVTAISGSGPAYFFLLADSLVRACGDLGFSAEDSHKLVGKTFRAAALLSKEGDFASLIKKIASKKGTTEAAVKILKKKNLERIIQQAVQAAYKRAKALSR